MNAATPSLFGITHSNRQFADAYYWGKNQFNSAFPAALACYMRSRDLPLIYVKYHDQSRTDISQIAVTDVFGSSLANEALYFAFESRFDAFRNLVHDDLPAIDLIICSDSPRAQIKPLEIKLTVLPDNTTESLSEDRYGAELVIRSATSRYMALSMAQSVQTRHGEVRQIFEGAFAKIRDWDSISEMLQAAPAAISALEIFLSKFRDYQTPLLLQPIWKTAGKSPALAEHCLDIFVWSDFALAHLFLDSARNAATGGNISRQLRTALRLSRFIYECSRGDKVYQAPIFDGMTYDLQNDKEFAISGTKSRGLMMCDRLIKPAVTKHEIKNIILGGGQKYLRPELRFDRKCAQSPFTHLFSNSIVRLLARHA